MPEINDPTSVPKILVTGATGRVGGSLLKLLTASHTPVRAMARREDQLNALRHNGIEAVQGDYDNPDTVRAAMDGCRQLFLVSTGGAAGLAQDCATIDSARDAGVEHIVKVSGSDANPDSSVPWAADYGRTDDYLRSSAVPYTILRPSCFMTNLHYLAEAIRRGVLPGTSGHGATTWTDPDDIAAAAHTVLTNPDPNHVDSERNYLLTSTQPLSFPQVADTLTEILGHRVRYVHIPGPVMYAGMRLSGSDHRDARGMVNQFADIVRHGRDDVRVFSTDLERLTGRPGTTLHAHIAHHRNTFTR